MLNKSAADYQELENFTDFGPSPESGAPTARTGTPDS
jgi:hypothetical protein